MGRFRVVDAGDAIRCKYGRNVSARVTRTILHHLAMASLQMSALQNGQPYEAGQSS